MINRYLFYTAVFVIVIYGISFSLAYGYADIGQIMANKYYLTLNNKTTTVFYFLHNLNTSNPDISNMDYVGKISHISIEPNKNALPITLDNILTNDELSIGFDSNLFSSNN